MADVTREGLASLVYVRARLVLCDFFDIHVIASIDESLVFDELLKPARMAWARFQFDMGLLLTGPLGLDFDAHTSWSCGEV